MSNKKNKPAVLIVVEGHLYRVHDKLKIVDEIVGAKSHASAIRVALDVVEGDGAGKFRGILCAEKLAEPQNQTGRGAYLNLLGNDRYFACHSKKPKQLSRSHRLW